MPNVRPINEKKYQISKRRFAELYNFCLQYNEWKDELQYKTDNPSADRRKELSDKCKLVEQTAIEAGPDIYPYLFKAVTNDLSYNYLKTVMGIPCGKDMYYDRRKKFYWLLSQKK